MDNPALVGLPLYPGRTGSLALTHGVTP